MAPGCGYLILRVGNRTDENLDSALRYSVTVLPPRAAFQPGYEKTRSTTPAGRVFVGGAPCPIANKGNDVVRIRSRTWTLVQIEDLTALIAAGSTAANAAVALRRSITVVRAKARNLGTPFQIVAEDRRRLKPSESFI